ncbi:inactive hydroxysteroid dehydrogenase-like protein 1 [Rhineura floridana]|uniref:inactive hydroxysteroid dehydrogenase-like protein 1 n=1 Tax=Rhineura floridana TaxID=261503 RepID=UPI002AC85572|nr:inactive hydroxysteroid dehydrogenase-like protein 1 [Rhineura floridana]XP_061449679.1 inactive hydroxysteroid dehydrogenase-like protein 1 [Rhineura floridana]XP_061449680.1 inactive hydroxysteroid dehydrogenase-like protein 1 [Rhineura floridana]XP_061449681.1 inactive hydroxysteroid dehydrogenase-like protein 1 [Rhineura floridana]
MAAVDSFSFLLREIERSCSYYIETLAIIGALYTAKTCLTVVSDIYTLIRLHFIPRLISRADLVKLYGSWAIVTGCTSGIGKSYAKELASRGVNIILISWNKETLEAFAKEIEDSYKVETAVIVADFSRGREICPAIKKALMDKEAGILVNSVGVFYDHPDYFTNLTEDKIWDLININIGAANMMVHMVLPGMLRRKKGAIVNVSSLSCCHPTPLMAAYSASKAYLDHFSRALHYEYAPKGIFVQSLTPSFISTNLTKFSSTLTKKSFFVPSADEYAHHAVTTLGLSKRTTGYWPHSILFLFAQYLPEWLWAWGACRMGCFL